MRDLHAMFVAVGVALLVTSCGGVPPPPSLESIATEVEVPALPSHRPPPPPPPRRLATPNACRPDIQVGLLGIDFWPGECPAYPPIDGREGLCPSGQPCMRPCRAVTYDWDVVGGPPSRRELRFDYDAFGRLSAVTSHGGGDPPERRVVPACTHEPAGCATRAIFEGGRLVRRWDADGETRFEWDSRGRLAAIEPPHADRVELVYDPRGRLVRVGTFELDYDVEGRLLGTKGFGGVSFTYDAEGRVATRRGGVLPVGSRFFYDARGRLVRRETWSLGFEDPEEGIVGITHYFYDCRGHAALAAGR